MHLITRITKTSKQHDVIMVVVDKLSKEDHFIAIKSTHKSIEMNQIFMREISRLHGIPKNINLD